MSWALRKDKPSLIMTWLRLPIQTSTLQRDSLKIVLRKDNPSYPQRFICCIVKSSLLTYYIELKWHYYWTSLWVPVLTSFSSPVFRLKRELTRTCIYQRAPAQQTRKPVLQLLIIVFYWYFNCFWIKYVYVYQIVGFSMKSSHLKNCQFESKDC